MSKIGTHVMIKSSFQIHAAFSVHAWRQKLMVQDRLCTEQPVLLGVVRFHVPAQSTARQSFSYKWAAAGGGGGGGGIKIN